MKAAYGVGEVLEQLSIGRTSLYAAVKRRELNPVKFGRKTLFYATDLAAFLTRLRQAQIKIEPTASRRTLSQGECHDENETHFCDKSDLDRSGKRRA